MTLKLQTALPNFFSLQKTIVYMLYTCTIYHVHVYIALQLCGSASSFSFIYFFVIEEQVLLTPPHGDHLNPSPRSHSCSPQVSPTSLSPTLEVADVSESQDFVSFC